MRKRKTAIVVAMLGLLCMQGIVILTVIGVLLWSSLHQGWLARVVWVPAAVAAAFIGTTLSGMFSTLGDELYRLQREEYLNRVFRKRL
ncbi:MAG: hypothetical protein ACYDHY_09435 [Acidiferrobacterales bacterium]